MCVKWIFFGGGEGVWDWGVGWMVGWMGRCRSVGEGLMI